MSTITIDISPKENYEPLYNPPDGIRYIDLWGGRSRGGSYEGTLYGLFRLTSPSYARIALVRQIHRDIRASLWQDFKDRVFDEEGANMNPSDFRLADSEMTATYLPTGNIIKAFGIKADSGRTAKVKSIAGYNLIIIEEADELSEDDFDKLDDSLRTTKGDYPILVVRIFNPPGKKHWIWRDYNLLEAEPPAGVDKKDFRYWRAVPKTNSRILSIFSTYEDNIDQMSASTIEKFEGYKIKKPEYYWTIVKGLISEGQKGRIYSGWEYISDEVFDCIDKRQIYWLDFGWSESPMAFGGLKFENDRAYGREYIYEPMDLKSLAKQLIKLGIKSSDLIIADAAELESIRTMREGWLPKELTADEIEKYPGLMKGFNVVKCIKGPGSVKAGISAVKELKMHFTEGSANIWNEYTEYKWALDQYKNPTDEPEEGNDHHCDGIRYVVSARNRSFNQ